MRKSIIVLFLVTFLVCGMSSTCLPAGTFDNRDYEGTEIRLAMDYAEMVNFLNQIVPEFEQMTGIKVVVDLIPYTEHRDKLVLDLFSKTGYYDLMQIGINWFGEFIELGNYLEPLNQFIDDPRFPNPKVDEIMPKLWEIYSAEYKDKVYGFPFIPDAMVFGYNKEMFNKIGLERAPKTWEEVYDYGKKLTQDIDGDGKTDQYGLALMAGGGVQTMCTYSLLFYAYGGRFFDEQGMPCFNSDSGIKAMKMFLKLLEVAPPAALESDIAEATQQMAQGLTAMIASWPAAVLATLEDPEKSKVVGKVAYTIPPNESTIIGGFSMGISRFVTDKEKEASYLFMNWLSSPEVDKKKALAGLTPIRTTTYQDEEVLKKYPYIAVFRDALTVGKPWPSRAGTQEAWNIIQDCVSKTLIGKLLPEDAVRRIDDDILTMLKRRGEM